MSNSAELLYLVIAGQHIDQYTPERDLKDMTWVGTVKDIAQMQFENLQRVVEIGTGRDVTSLMLQEVMTIWADRDEPLSYKQYSFVELHVSTRAARAFMRAA